jgi:hypothetical protein
MATSMTHHYPWYGNRVSTVAVEAAIFNTASSPGALDQILASKGKILTSWFLSVVQEYHPN